jgi:hypothetical protein
VLNRRADHDFNRPVPGRARAATASIREPGIYPMATFPPTLASAFAMTAALIVAGAAAPAHGAGIIDLNQECAIAGCFEGDAPNFPITITQPGHYRLTSDLESAGLAGIQVELLIGHVTLDLNGHTMDGGNTCSVSIPVTGCVHSNGGPGVTIRAASGSLRNGIVRGFRGDGVRGTLSGGFLIEDMTIMENGNNGVALNLAETSFGLTIRNSRIVRNAGHGFTDSFGAGNRHTHIDDSLFVGNGNTGAVLSSGTVVRSTFHWNGGTGVSGSNCRIIGSHLYNNNNGGAQLTACFGTGNLCASGTC